MVWCHTYSRVCVGVLQSHTCGSVHRKLASHIALVCIPGLGMVVDMVQVQRTN